ncbi:MAG: class II aldolase/adducin family protein [Candidatus Bathyarchaeia archaeon]
MERYVGVKFRTEFLRRETPVDDRIAELAGWCRKFHDLGLAPIFEGKSMGNLSFRVSKGANEFIITASGLSSKDILEPDCFVRVVECNVSKCVVYVYGLREPSSESLLHYRIYELRSDVNAIFHGHDPQILRYAGTMGIVETREKLPYGSLELVKSVEEILDGNNFIVIKGHGFLSLGSSMEEAGLLAIKQKRAVEDFAAKL